LGATSVEAAPKSCSRENPWLEIESSSKLDESRSSSRTSSRSCGLAKQSTVDVVIWQAKVYGVEDIEKVGANRKAGALSQRETLDNREVDFVERRSIE